jgi:threonine/homoserine/homoserine lactone efflux protein
MLTELVAFVPVAAVVICTPGPDTALTIRNALAGGRAAGILTAAGVAIGQGVWTVAASLGLTGPLRASTPAFLALKVAGAAYLVFLGVQSLRAARARLLTFGWLTVYSLVVARARVLFDRPRIRRSLDALTGCVLIGLGVRLATEQH